MSRKKIFLIGLEKKRGEDNANQEGNMGIWDILKIILDDIKKFVKSLMPWLYIISVCVILLLGIYLFGLLMKWTLGVNDATLIAWTILISISLLLSAILGGIIYIISKYIMSVKARLRKNRRMEVL